MKHVKIYLYRSIPLVLDYEYRRLTDVWVGLTEPLGQKSIVFNNLLWQNGKMYYHGTGAI